jgi:hypothetical protein
MQQWVAAGEGHLTVNELGPAKVVKIVQDCGSLIERNGLPVAAILTVAAGKVALLRENR